MFAEPALFLHPEPCPGAISKRSPRAGDKHKREQHRKPPKLDQKPGPQPPATAPGTETYWKTAQSTEKRPRTFHIICLLGRDDAK